MHVAKWHILKNEPHRRTFSHVAIKSVMTVIFIVLVWDLLQLLRLLTSPILPVCRAIHEHRVPSNSSEKKK